MSRSRLLHPRPRVWRLVGDSTNYDLINRSLKFEMIDFAKNFQTIFSRLRRSRRRFMMLATRQKSKVDSVTYAESALIFVSAL